MKSAVSDPLMSERFASAAEVQYLQTIVMSYHHDVTRHEDHLYVMLCLVIFVAALAVVALWCCVDTVREAMREAKQARAELLSAHDTIKRITTERDKAIATIARREILDQRKEMSP